MSEMSQNSLPNVCGAKTKFGNCQSPPMENGRCRLHGGLTPKNHPNHKARLNALKTGRYAKSFIKQIELMNNELNHLDELIRNSEVN